MKKILEPKVQTVSEMNSFTGFISIRTQQRKIISELNDLSVEIIEIRETR